MKRLALALAASVLATSPAYAQATGADWSIVRQKQQAWSSSQSSSDHYVVVPPSYGTQRERYMAVAAKLCKPQELCTVRFWFDAGKVPATDELDDWTDDQRNAQIAAYYFFPEAHETIPELAAGPRLILSCRLDPKPPCLVPYPR